MQEKLAMKTASLTQDRLREFIEQFPSCRIAVLGDFFLDKYLDVDPDLEETSVETGKPAHQVVAVRSNPGAAGTVVCNLASLGAGRLYAVGFTGDDGEGFELRKALDGLGCSTKYLEVVADRRTPTYLKPRTVTENSLTAEHSRYDTKNRIKTTREVEAKVLTSLDKLLPSSDAVVILDQVEEPDCGVVTKAVREAMAERARSFGDVLFWADSRRWIRQFRNMTVKSNECEAAGREARSQDEVVDAAELMLAIEELRTKNGAPVVVTRGALGMVVSEPEWTNVPAVSVEGEIDSTGAGDSATAGTVLALAAGGTLPEAAVVGNLVASITIQQIGTTGVAKPHELSRRLALWHEQLSRR